MPEEAQPVVIEQETPSDEEVSTEEETAEVTEAPAESATEEITEAPEESEPEKTTEIPMEEATKDFSEGLSEEEFDEALEEAENQETYDQETGLDLEIVLTAARDQDIDLFALEEGESVEFYVEAPSLIVKMCIRDRVKADLDALFAAQYSLTAESSTETITEKKMVRVGESLGQVVTSGYCSCPICCGPVSYTHLIDILIGAGTAVAAKLLMWQKQQDAKKLRKGVEYGSARWGDRDDIKPYMSDNPWRCV